MDYKDLRIKYPEFIYKGFSQQMVGKNLVCNFKYEINPDINFDHNIIIRDVGDTYKQLDNQILNNLIFNVGIAEIPSYWKSTCSPVIKIEAGNLDRFQIEWWEKLFKNGMMQYFYSNKIDFRDKDFLTIESKELKSSARFLDNVYDENSNKVLIPIGGGKDSVVTLDLIAKSEKEFGTLVIEKASTGAHKVSKLVKSEHLVAYRDLDYVKLIELNNKGFLRGHVPYSASLYFCSLLVAYIFSYKNILFSNEYSSSEANINYLGKQVNHQYSKTLEFENDFRQYNKDYLSDINLFSFLRPLYEIQISKLFAKMEKYFTVIRSCNVGQKDGIWCGKCPKCLSTYILLFPFLGKDKTVEIFGKDLLSDGDLEDLLFELIDDNKVKPFECVGTRLELKIALNIAVKDYKEKLPVLLQKFKNSPQYDENYLNNKEKEIMNFFGQNNLSDVFLRTLKKNL